MAHDPTKVLLGTTVSSGKTITNEPADPATFVAGLAVRRKTDGGLQTADDSTAALIGVSLGVSLTDAKKTSIVRKGLGIPLRLVTLPASGDAEIVSYADLLDGDFDSFTIGEVTFVAQAGAVTEGDATFQAATGEAETATSFADQINSHTETAALVTAEADGAVVTVTANAEGPAGSEIVFLFNDNTGNEAGTVSGSGTLEQAAITTAVVGGQVSVNDEGKGCAFDDEDAAATGASYATEVMKGVDVSGVQCWVALVDIRGSL